jgi:hypothetical protein
VVWQHWNPWLSSVTSDLLTNPQLTWGAIFSIGWQFLEVSYRTIQCWLCCGLVDASSLWRQLCHWLILYW